MIFEGPIDLEALQGVLANAAAEEKTVYGQVLLDPGSPIPSLAILTKDRGTYGASVNISLEEVEV